VISQGDLDWEYLVRRACRAGPRRVLSLLLYAESNDLFVPRGAVVSLDAAVHGSGEASFSGPRAGEALS
jgi:hypothetical protein